MHSGRPSSLLRIVLVLLMVFATAIVTQLTLNSVASSKQQQEPTRGNPPPQGEAARERKIGIGIPKHLPLKFEIRNLNSDRWAYDLEIDVTNTSTKPIYSLAFFITVPGYKSKLTGNQLGFWFRYGRIELVDFTEPLRADDIPIAPGEKHTFKISEGLAKGWEDQSRREGRPEPKILNLQFQRLNFGDGTGFETTAGEPIDIHKRRGGAGAGIQPRPPTPANQSSSYLPAMFLPVNFCGNDFLANALKKAKWWERRSISNFERLHLSEPPFVGRQKPQRDIGAQRVAYFAGCRTCGAGTELRIGRPHRSIWKSVPLSREG